MQAATGISLKNCEGVGGCTPCEPPAPIFIMMMVTTPMMMMVVAVKVAVEVILAALRLIVIYVAEIQH